MTKENFTSLHRLMTTVNHKEPDRVPFFLPLTMHGAKELGVSIKEYYSRAESVVEGQLRMLKKYRHDGVYGFFYASAETEAWGGEVIFFEDGPPNSGEPFIRKPEDIRNLIPPKVSESRCLAKVLKTDQMLKARLGSDVPIIGVVISPFSLPVMQMGFEKYIELIYEQPELFDQLMKVNEEFCVEWANAQLKAGATIICYYDPVSSTTIIPREMYQRTGFIVSKRTIARIKGPTATGMASARCLPIIKEIQETGTKIIGACTIDDMAEMKMACKEKLVIMGSLNGIEMCRWKPDEAESIVKESIAKLGSGGGYILSDNHGEIPYQVQEDVLLAISDAVYKWGSYPLKWLNNYVN